MTDSRATNPTSSGPSLLDRSTAKPGDVDMSIFDKKKGQSASGQGGGQNGQGTVNSEYLKETREDDPWPAGSSGASPGGTTAQSTKKVELSSCKISTPVEELATDKPFEATCDVKVLDPSKPPENFTVHFKLFASIAQEDGSFGTAQFMEVKAEGAANKTDATQTVKAKANLVSPTPPVKRGTKIRYYVEAEHWDCPGVTLKSDEVEVVNVLLPKPVTNWALHPNHFDFDSSAILPTAAKDFPQLKKMLDANPDTLLAIFGHADPVGEDENNKKLSLRRAKMLYALLTRNVDIWLDLSKKTGGDDWGTKANQRMLATIKDKAGNAYHTGSIDGVTGPVTLASVKRFQGDNGLSKDGVLGAKSKAKLYPAYMDAICVDESGKPYKLGADSFMGDAALNAKVDAKAKGAYQGCSEFNPVYLMSKSDVKNYATKPNKKERDERNQIDRRTVVALFKKDAFSATDPKKPQWPCPDSSQPCTKCKDEFWPDGDARRQSGDAERKYPADQTTMACMFYSGVAEKNIEKTTTKPDIGITTEDGSKPAAQEMMAATTIKWKAAAKTGMTGTFKWSSTSPRLELSGQDTDTLTIKAKDEPSPEGSPEEIKLEFLPTGIQSPLVLTWKLKVFRITVDGSKVAFGFDANQSIIPPAIPSPPPAQRGAIAAPFNRTPEAQPYQVSVQSGFETDLVIEFKGGPLDLANFAYEIADTTKASVTSSPTAGGAAPYKVVVKGLAPLKDMTTLVIKHLPTGQECLKFEIRVYKEFACKAVVLLIEDKRHAASTLSCRQMTPTDTQNGINETYKFAVANLTLEGPPPSTAIPGKPSSHVIDLEVWNSARNAVIFDYTDHSADCLAAINTYVAANFAGKQVVAIVKRMVTFIRLTSDAEAGQPEISVGGAGRFYGPGSKVTVGNIYGAITDDDNMTIDTVTKVSSTEYKIKFKTNLGKAHAAGTHGVTFSAAGWSGNPIMVAENNSTQKVVIETAGHELGHSLLKYKDVEDNHTMMNYMVGIAKAELHHKPMILRYDNEDYTKTESQWDLLKRT
ncbi:MAG: hypothetical protein RL173_362 [Fibrobacterota bacterium]|jgi:outer membrane protein OmpA-like peptidoglycan-associated protein/peptidoglycan hydrolase-like protein with peptidoglycan-binding domain